MSWAADLQETLMGITGVTLQIGSETYGGNWTIAEPSRARAHLPEGEWDVPAYLATLPARVRDNPSFINGGAITNMVNGVEGVIRFVNDATNEHSLQAITILVLLIDRG